MRFAGKIGLMAATAALIIGPLLGAAVFLQARAQLEERIVHEQVQEAARVLEEIDKALLKGRADITVIASDNFLRRYLDTPSASAGMADAVADELAERAELTGPWDGMAVFDRQGRRAFSPMAADDIGSPADNDQTRIAFENALAGQPYVSGQVLCPRTGQPMLILAAPVSGQAAADQVIGVVVAHYTWQPIQEILDHVEGTATLHLFDRQGSQIGARSGDRLDAIPPQAIPGRQPLPGGQAGYAILNRSSHGGGAVLVVDLRQTAGAHVAEHGWTLVLEKPLDVMFAPIVTLAWNTGLLVFGILIVTALLFASLGHRFIRPLKDLVSGVRQVELGRFDRKVAVSSKDEFGELANNFNHMIDQLQAAQDALVRKEQQAMLGRVAASVGHELRNPLGAMSNAVYYLQTVLDDADDGVKEYLAIIRDEIARSEHIVAMLLEAVQTRPPVPGHCGVAELVEQALRRSRLPANVSVHLDIPAPLPAIRVDAGQIQQALEGLISNASDAMPEGGELTIRAAMDAASGTLTLAVSDTGCGIPPEDMARLFEPLFTTKARGIGLGLVLARNQVQANGGRIMVESEPGRGTTVTLGLPEGGPADDRKPRHA